MSSSNFHFSNQVHAGIALLFGVSDSLLNAVAYMSLVRYYGSRSVCPNISYTLNCCDVFGITNCFDLDHYKIFKPT